MPNPLSEDLDHVLAHTAGYWEEMRGQKIFITGATGFFGCWLLESFAWVNEKLDLRAQAVALTRNLDRFRKKAPHLANHPAIKFQIGDVRDFDFPAEKFAFVIHAATEASGALDRENPTLMRDTIVEGTSRALDFAAHCGARKFLLTSSGAIYGPQPPEITHIPEDLAVAPTKSAYAEGKRTAELLCEERARQNGVEAKITRCFAFVGPYLPLDSHFAIGNFIGDALGGGPIRVRGDGTPYRSYLYAADLAIWLWTILFSGKNGRPYNVGSERAFSIIKIADRVNEAFASKLKVHVAQQPIYPKSPDRYVPSTRRASEELNLSERIELVEAIRKTVAWNAGRI